MNVSQLRAARPDQLDGAADAFNRIAETLGNARSDFTSQVNAVIMAGSWRGTAAGAASAAGRDRAGRLGDAGGQMRVAGQAVAEFAGVLRDAQRLLGQAESLAQANRLRLGEDGSVTPLPAAGPPSPELEAARQQAAREAQGLASRALAHATAGDQACASRLAQVALPGAQRRGDAATPPAGDDGLLREVLSFFLGDVANFWSGRDGSFPWGSGAMGALRVFRTSAWLRALSRSGFEEALSRFPTFNTGLFGRGLAAVGERIPGLAGGAAWLRTPGATTFFRRAGIVGGAVSTAVDAANLVRQGNPVEAFQREGAGYVADVARTGFSASTTAFFVAPNPVTGAMVIGTGAVWLGAEVWDHWGDDISEAVGDAWDATTDFAGDAADAVGDAWDSAADTAGDVVSSLNPFD